MNTLAHVLVSISDIAREELAAVEQLTARLPNDPKLQALFANGVDIFDDADRFGRWLRTPSPALGRPPLFCLVDGDIGLVQDELTRIQYGDFS
jgi:hypothetical protein